MILSIITINRNDKEGLQNTIESVLCQTFTSFEFIVIDGASTDGSIELLASIDKKNIKWQSESDTGIYNAMNKGVRLAKGKYLYFLNAGDRLKNKDVLYEVFANQIDAPFICTNFYSEDASKNIKLQAPYKNKDWSFALYDIYSTYLCHQAFFIRRDNFDKYGLYSEDLKITADWEFFLIAIGLHNEKVSYEEVNLVIYNLEGLSSTIGGKMIYQEKRKVTQRRLSPQLSEKLHKIYQLEQDAYIVEAVNDNYILSFAVRIFCYIKRKLSNSR